MCAKLHAKLQGLKKKCERFSFVGGRASRGARAAGRRELGWAGRHAVEIFAEAPRGGRPPPLLHDFLTTGLPRFDVKECEKGAALDKMMCGTSVNAARRANGFAAPRLPTSRTRRAATPWLDQGVQYDAARECYTGCGGEQLG